MASHHIWAAKSSLFAFVSSIFLLIMSYFYRQILCSFCPWLVRVSEQSLTMASLLMSSHSSFWSWDCGKWRASRHASIDMRACHCSKSRWVRLSEENIKKTIPMFGTFSFWFLSEFSLQCLPPAYTLGFFVCPKVKHNALKTPTLVRKESYEYRLKFLVFLRNRAGKMSHSKRIHLGV